MPETDIEPRLDRCFRAVFPKLDGAEVHQASPDTLADWDSVATVNLLNLIAEEFGIEVDWDHLDEINSFDAAAALIRNRRAG